VNAVAFPAPVVAPKNTIPKRVENTSAGLAKELQD